MSIERLEGDMKTASDPTLIKMHKKINELVQAENDNFKASVETTRKIAEIEKELNYLKAAVRNF